MEKTYQVGSGNAQITLNVTVGTVGVAYSKFSVMKNFRNLDMNGESKPKSGNIENAILGKADELQDTIVTVRILINFSHLNKDERESAVDVFLRNNPPVSFEFSGGQEGVKLSTFNKEMDLVIAPNKKILSITSQINLI